MLKTETLPQQAVDDLIVLYRQGKL